jgi:hypothetical protein
VASQLEITRNKAPHVPVGVIWGPRAVPPRTRARAFLCTPRKICRRQDIKSKKKHAVFDICLLHLTFHFLPPLMRRPAKNPRKIDPHPMLVSQKPPKHVNHYIPTTYPIKKTPTRSSSKSPKKGRNEQAP